MGVAARISTGGLLDVLLATTYVTPRWQQSRKDQQPGNDLLTSFEEHVIQGTEELQSETLWQLHRKKWKERECLVACRDNRWSLEVSEQGECIMTAQLSDVRLTERYGQSQLPEEARSAAHLAFALEGRVWDRRREHFLYTQWVFGTSDEHKREHWTKLLGEKISAAANYAYFPPFQLASSRIFRGLVVTSTKGWNAVSLPWLRELDAAAGDGEQAQAKLELSPTHLGSTPCERIAGCVIATSIEQRERLGAEFAVLSNARPSEAALVKGNFWTPTTAAGAKTGGASEDWGKRIQTLTDGAQTQPAPALPPPEASTLADFGPSFGTIREWVLQVGGDADKEKMIAKRTQQTGFLKTICSKLLIG